MKYKLLRKKVNKKLILSLSIIYFSLLLVFIIYTVYFSKESTSDLSWQVMGPLSLLYLLILPNLIGNKEVYGIIDIDKDRIRIESKNENLILNYSEIESIYLYYDGYDGEARNTLFLLRLRSGTTNFFTIKARDFNKKIWFYCRHDYDIKDLKSFVSYMKNIGVKINSTLDES